METVQVNEIFCSLQGEGVRAGTLNVFVRFAGCNLTCSRDGEAGFDCDTEFVSGRKMTIAELYSAVTAFLPCKAIVFTGGEPALQLTRAVVEYFQAQGYYCAIETNGTVNIDELGLDWVCVSPKTAEHTLQQLRADEVKYVRHAGQAIPRPRVQAMYQVLSPAVQADGAIRREDFEAVVQLIRQHPQWRLSTQQHKLWKLR